MNKAKNNSIENIVLKNLFVDLKNKYEYSKRSEERHIPIELELEQAEIILKILEERIK